MAYRYKIPFDAMAAELSFMPVDAVITVLDGAASVTQGAQTISAIGVVPIDGGLPAQQYSQTILSQCVAAVSGMMDVNQSSHAVAASGGQSAGVEGTVSAVQAANTLMAGDLSASASLRRFYAIDAVYDNIRSIHIVMQDTQA